MTPRSKGRSQTLPKGKTVQAGGTAKLSLLGWAWNAPYQGALHPETERRGEECGRGEIIGWSQSPRSPSRMTSLAAGGPESHRRTRDGSKDHGDHCSESADSMGSRETEEGAAVSKDRWWLRAAGPNSAVMRALRGSGVLSRMARPLRPNQSPHAPC